MHKNLKKAIEEYRPKLPPLPILYCHRCGDIMVAAMPKVLDASFGDDGVAQIRFNVRYHCSSNSFKCIWWDTTRMFNTEYPDLGWR